MRNCMLLGAAALVLIAGVSLPAAAQIAAESKADAAVTPTPVVTETKDDDAAARSTYVLGADDQIIVKVLEAEEIDDKPIRIDPTGNIRLPMAGRIQAAGLTIEQLELNIAERLKEFIKEPQVTVWVTEFRSQPVSVLGSVKNPGVHQLEGRKTLVEILSLAGGLADDAGHSVKITRRLEWGDIPLKNAQKDPSGGFSTAEVSLKSIMEAKSPEENILIRPQDVVTVPRAELVYVTGFVTKSGGFVLRERETLSVLQALSLAGGLAPGASTKNARLLRSEQGEASRTEIAVNLQKILAGQAADVAMQPEDILFIPSNAPKKAFLRGVEAAIQVGTGIVIWRR